MTCRICTILANDGLPADHNPSRFHTDTAITDAGVTRALLDQKQED